MSSDKRVEPPGEEDQQLNPKPEPQTMGCWGSELGSAVSLFSLIILLEVMVERNKGTYLGALHILFPPSLLTTSNVDL